MNWQKQVAQQLSGKPANWLVTGAAGFIGSHLVEGLLQLGQRVVGLDNFATGKRRNIELALEAAGGDQSLFRLIEGDIRDLTICREGCRGVDYVLHQAALGSVPRSIDDPKLTHEVNATGTLNMLLAAREEGARRFVYASSSSVYGDDPGLPKVEERTGRPLSPYAVSKRAGEEYAEVFSRLYGMETIGLRYFGVFGPRQDPNGQYAAVIPRWVRTLSRTEPVSINGDGSTSRDFCYVENVVQANVRAATVLNGKVGNKVFNVALGGRTTLNELFAMLRDELERANPSLVNSHPRYEPFRKGDILHSQADISKVSEFCGYAPEISVREGLQRTVEAALKEGK